MTGLRLANAAATGALVPRTGVAARDDRTGGPVPQPGDGTSSRRWESWHLFLAAPQGTSWQEVADRVLTDEVAPLLARWDAEGRVERHFFIRYSELGHHLRLRLQIVPGQEEGLRRDLFETFGCGALEEDDAGPLHPSSHCLVSHLRPIVYEPEWVRYGGGRGVELAEEVFHASSELTFELLQGSAAADHEARSAQAVLAMTVLLRAFTGDRVEASTFASAYARSVRELHRRGELADRVDSWPEVFDAAYTRQAAALRGVVDAVWDALGAGESIPEPFATYHRRLVAVARQVEAGLARGEIGTAEQPLGSGVDGIRRLIVSYLHMGSNRLGIALIEECYLGHLTALLLAPEADDPSLETAATGETP